MQEIGNILSELDAQTLLLLNSLYEFYGSYNVVCYHKVDMASSICNDIVCYNSYIVS